MGQAKRLVPAKAGIEAYYLCSFCLDTKRTKKIKANLTRPENPRASDRNSPIITSTEGLCEVFRCRSAAEIYMSASRDQEDF
jgi:hypothetical protein